MIASAPSQSTAASAAGPWAPCRRDDAALDERLGLADGERVEPAAVGVADAVDVGQQHELAGAEPGRDAGRGVVGVDVADDAVLVAGEGRDDRDLAADEDRVEQVAPQADDAGDEPELGIRSAISRPPSTPDSPTASTPRSRAGDELAVDDSPENRRGHLERAGVGDAQAALEAGRDAEPLEPLGDALTAAVDETTGRCRAIAATSSRTCCCSAMVVPPSLTTRISLMSCTRCSR